MEVIIKGADTTEGEAEASEVSAAVESLQVKETSEEK